MNLKFILFVLVVALFVGCTQNNTPSPATTNITTNYTNTNSTTNSTSLVNITNITNTDNQFALSFYSSIKNTTDGNIFYSPYSISTAFAMVYEGARGQTADEIQSVFHFQKDDAIRRALVAASYDRLNPSNASYSLSTANALWVQDGYHLLSNYTSAVERYYGGKVTNVDFVGATEETRQTINAWVENKTNGKIKDLFASGMINPTSRFVLTNTIYFKGAWANVFEKSATSNQDFKVNPNKSIKVQMMRQTDWFNYAETDDLQVLELPYKGQKLSMVILLPKSDDLKSVENQLSSEKLGQLRGNLSTKRVDISIPKFKFTTSYILNDNLQEIGMSSAFSGNADFSGITGDRNLFIGTAIHKAYIDVNEEGTEAAAATGIGMVGTSMPHQEPPPIIFRADHPFIFLIQETQTGNILFMGRVANPAES